MSCCCSSYSWSPPTCPSATVTLIKPSSSSETFSLLSASSSLIQMVLVGGCGWRSAMSSLNIQRTGCLSCLPKWCQCLLRCFSCCCRDREVVTEKSFCSLLTRLTATYGVVVLAMALTALVGSLEALCREGLSELESALHAECVKVYCSLVLAESQLKLESPEEVDGFCSNIPRSLTDPGAHPFGLVLLVQKVCSVSSARISSS